MMKGLENVFKTGVEYGTQIALNGNQQTPKDIGSSPIFSLEDRNDDK